MDTKSQITTMIEMAIREFQDLEKEVPVEVLHQKGSLKEWAARDDVIHCAVYAQRFVEHLAWPRDHAREEDGDFLKTNDEIWESHQTETWEESLKMWVDACRAVLQGIQPLSNEELESNRTFTWLGEQTPSAYICGLIFTHAMIHKQYIYSRLGRQRDALACADRGFEMVERWATSDVDRGRNLYNKACSYALAGERKSAIPMVAQALKWTPSLLDWSQKDTDLDSLRDDPEFQRIYEQA